MPQHRLTANALVLFLSQMLFLAVFTISGVVIAGYLTNVSALYQWPRSVAMAIPTAVCNVLLSLGGLLVTLILGHDSKTNGPG